MDLATQSAHSAAQAMTSAAQALLRWGGFDDPRNTGAAAELQRLGFVRVNDTGALVLTEAGADRWSEVRHG